MKENKIIKHYACFFLELSQGSQIYHLVKDDVDYLLKLCNNRYFYGFLCTPIYRKRTKVAVLKSILVHQISITTWNFLQLLIQKERISHLEDILLFFLKKYQENEGIGKTHLTVAQPLNQMIEQDFVKFIKELTNWKKVKITVDIDPKLLGGYVLQIGNKRLDVSIRRRISNLRSFWNQSLMPDKV